MNVKIFDKFKKKSGQNTTFPYQIVKALNGNIPGECTFFLVKINDTPFLEGNLTSYIIDVCCMLLSEPRMSLLWNFPKETVRCAQRCE